uniref:Putative secreted mucin n=1 Tax=Amblyomma cajennense TaxID=34607 RepID=A0A023FCF2_AMBCJ
MKTLGFLILFCLAATVIAYPRRWDGGRRGGGPRIPWRRPRPRFPPDFEWPCDRTRLSTFGTSEVTVGGSTFSILPSSQGTSSSSGLPFTLAPGGVTIPAIPTIPAR